jgi:cytochrome b6
MIINDVPHGWLIRSLHSWAANLMIGSLFIHMFSVFLLKSYRKPRELMWLSGVLLLFLALAFGFTGYLLPWDTTAYFATLIGTQVPKTLPLVGDWGMSLLSGGDDIGAETLTRMYTIHVIILPLISVLVVSFHLLLNQLFGPSVPLGAATKAPPIPFFPNYVFRDLVAWCMGFVALVSLATLLPWGLGEKANPFSSAPIGIKPEWYFLPLYQSLRMVPPRILFVNGEFIVNALVVVASLFWLAIPVLDRRSQRGESGWAFTVVGITVILYLTLTIFLAYTT